MIAPEPIKATHFIRNLIESDLAAGKHASRRWSGPAAIQAAGAPDPMKIRTRFPPEPNGYLHFGHAKSILLNFGLAHDFGGACHLRFDDTNPEKEDQEYVDSIVDAVRWLGCHWGENRYYASNYFPWMYEFAVALIEAGHAYVDSQSAEEMRAHRGTLTEAGKDSPYRDRSIAENRDLFSRMKAGEFPDGTHILRAKIDMAAPNINLRDPAIYRIRHATHHNTGNTWCIYPMYAFAHPIEDALENITHSICTLEFEDQRPFYEWLLERLADQGLLARPLPQQIEFSRLNLTYGVSKSDSWIDMCVLEDCMREDLNVRAERRIAVLDPLKLIIDNYPADAEEICHAPNHPLKPELGKREIPFSHELWIEREDFMETPSKGYHRLYPGNMARLRYGFVIKCTGCDKDAEGHVIAVHAELQPDSKSGTPGADNYKVKGNLHWISTRHAYHAEIRLYDRLFAVANPGARRDGDAEGMERNYLDDINPASRQTLRAYLEPCLKQVQAEESFQFERHGYFIADRIDSKDGSPVFNRTVTLKDSWNK